VGSPRATEARETELAERGHRLLSARDQAAILQGRAGRKAAKVVTTTNAARRHPCIDVGREAHDRGAMMSLREAQLIMSKFEHERDQCWPRSNATPRLDERWVFFLAETPFVYGGFVNASRWWSGGLRMADCDEGGLLCDVSARSVDVTLDEPWPDVAEATSRRGSFDRPR